jgi:hypothetical protein
MRLAGWFVMVSSLAVTAVSCGFFDPLHPYDQEPVDTSVSWQRYMGGSGDEVGYSVQQTSDGGFIIVGDTGSFGAGGIDIWLVKTDASGTVQWSKTFGGSEDDHGRCVVQTPDGGYIIAGFTTAGGQSYVYQVKTDQNGDRKWDSTFSKASVDDRAAVTCTADGGYAIVSSTSSVTTYPVVYLVKTDGSGVETWHQTYDEGTQTLGRFIRQTADGGYIIAGEIANNSLDTDGYLLKTNASGQKVWSRKYGLEYPDSATGVELTTDGYVLSGFTRSYGRGDFNAWLIRTDSQGNEQWDKTFGLDAYDRAEHVQTTPDGGFILAGMTKSYGGWEQAWLIKTDSTGALQWHKTFGGSGVDWAYCAALTADGGYVATGFTESFGAGGKDAYLIYYRP